MGRLAVGVLNTITVVSGILFAAVGVFGAQFAANDYRAGHGLPPQGTPLLLWLEALAIPISLIVVFVVPSSLLMRSGRPLLALSTALLPSAPAAVLLGFLLLKMS